MYGCVERFIPDIQDSQQQFLVVDGLITDQPGPYYVNITLSSSLDVENTNLSGVNVSIESETGEIENLNEISPGRYSTGSIQGVVGNSYRLNLVYQDTQFQSTWETILSATEIDSVYFEEQVKETSDKEIEVAGLQFYVNSKSQPDGPIYFRLEWEETWKIGVRWPPNYLFLGNDQLTNNPDIRSTCWKNNNPANINIASTSGLSNNELNRHPLQFITAEEERFSRRYSLKIKQYSLGEDEFIFWKNLQESNEEIGSLFDRQPATVIGNISSINESGDIILGYFSANGVAEYRRYINPSEVSSQLFLTPNFCNLDSMLKSDLGSAFESDVFERIEKGIYFYDFLYNDFTGAVLGAVMAAPPCADCTAKGGVLEKPDFWND
jgi:hypothetical protein